MTSVEVLRVVLFCVLLVAGIVVAIAVIRRADRRIDRPVLAPGEQREIARTEAEHYSRRRFDSMGTGA